MTNTTSTSNTDRLADLQRQMRDPATLGDQKAFDRVRAEAERLSILASVEAEQRAKRAAEERAVEEATAAEIHAANCAETIAKGTIDAQLVAIADRIAGELIGAEVMLGSLLAEHGQALAEARRLGCIGAFREPDLSGKAPHGAATMFRGQPQIAERMRILLADRLGGFNADRLAIHILPKG